MLQQLILMHNFGANENGFWGGVGNWSSLTTNNPFNSRFQNTNKLAFVSEL